MKKWLLSFVSAILCFVLVIPSTFAANINDVLLNPEAGWKRVDLKKNTPNITYVGSWVLDTTAKDYTGKTNGDSMGSSKDLKLRFDFTGNKLSIRSWLIKGEYSLIIDDVHLGNFKGDNSTKQYGVTYFNDSFSNGRHSVELSLTQSETYIDTIDIAEDGEILPFTGVQAPLNLTANYTKAGAGLQWDVVSNATYILKRSTSMGGPYTTIAENLSSPLYTDANVQYNTTYYYVVFATKDGRVSASSNEASVTIPVPSISLDIESNVTQVSLFDTFVVQAVLKNASNIYAEDFNIQYDDNRFKLISVEPVDLVSIASNTEINDNTIRLITASNGADNGINGNGVLVNLHFKAIAVGSGKIDALKARVADNGYNEITLPLEDVGETTIEVTPVADFSLKDLGAASYQLNNNKSFLSELLMNFLGAVGIVSQVDLTKIGEALLSSLSYEFNH
ncbi:Cohesin domain-containing protein [Paenibacillus algorifonticola]|uniref:Cohesin domain-containing protein n=1 Tax=Paenibacillus algorifonticola TaxID=684063 RepID=A0A1I2FA30_9BACL|nr:cohesin domain-containing protein [Paenibacillus algorifonticola]SFF02304.1 Cohesin domain-containing protein [Paenibacillus algorifonticola]